MVSAVKGKNWVGIGIALVIGFFIIVNVHEGYEQGEFSSSSSTSSHGHSSSASTHTDAGAGLGDFLYVGILFLVIGGVLYYFIRIRPRRSGGSNFGGKEDYWQAKQEEANALQRAQADAINARARAQADARARADRALQQARAQRASEVNKWVD